MDAAAAPSVEAFRRTVGLFTTGVTVVTTCAAGTLHGMTANAFASVSLDPLLVLVCVDRSAGMHDLLPESGTFAVSVLAVEQERESVWFASPRRPAGTDQFDDVDWQPTPVGGCPVLTGAVAWLDCRVTEMHGAGDHTIFIGEVVALGTGTGTEPLIYFGGGYRALAERADPGSGVAQNVPNSRSPKSPRPGTM